MTQTQLMEGYRFLYDNAGPLIKNEAALALGLGDGETRAGLLASPEVQYWIDCLHQFIQKRQAHNADDHCLENAMHKLLSFGIKEADDSRIRETNDFILAYLRTPSDAGFLNSINEVIAASWLACMGRDDATVTAIIKERINAAYTTAQAKIYDIHVSPEGYPAIPASRQMHPFVNPNLYANNCWRLPTVHDVFTYAHLPAALAGTPEISDKIETIIAYILDDRYQRLPLGYGLMLVPPNTYYGMGWSVHLYGYDENSPLGVSGLVWNMELLAFSKMARASDWFVSTLEGLNTYARDGIYELPKEYLGESHRKYYIGGGHMGLGEDRRKKGWRKMESTAWMLRILKHCL